MTISVVYGCLITVLMWLVRRRYLAFLPRTPRWSRPVPAICTVIFSMQSLPASTFALAAFFAAYGKSYIGFAHNVLAVALIRVPGAWLLSNAIPTRCSPWVSPRRADRFCRQSSA